MKKRRKEEKRKNSRVRSQLPHEPPVTVENDGPVAHQNRPRSVAVQVLYVLPLYVNGKWQAAPPALPPTV